MFVGGSLTVFSSDNRTSLIEDDGYTYNPAWGGLTGVDLYIPVFKGFYVQPGLFVGYTRDVGVKSTSNEFTTKYIGTVANC